MFSVLTETQSRSQFQNPPAGKRTLSKKIRFRDGSVWTVGLTPGGTPLNGCGQKRVWFFSRFQHKYGIGFGDFGHK